MIILSINFVLGFKSSKEGLFLFLRSSNLLERYLLSSGKMEKK